jgi:hypothetical protein
MGKAGEKQAASLRRRRNAPARKEAAPPIPGETLPKPGLIPLGGAAEALHHPGAAPAEPGPLPGSSDLTPQLEVVRHKKSGPNKRGKPRRGDQEAKLQQPSDPPTDNVDRTTEPDDARAASSKHSGNGLNPPEEDIIDLTIKEESLPGTPIPPVQAPVSDGEIPGLKAGWVRFQSFWLLVLSDKKSGLVPPFEYHITFHRHQKVVFDHRRGD